ncbi:hypothetical protein [Herbaspirillum sp. GW103]|uniref:hypothetical protein n=1 Tax=Herbaspirillum sp. GW103 TaxID=1175306 RepID=UPI0012F630F1|nr:hypothetical protein [Herbaspirillum sp. GW103]
MPWTIELTEDGRFSISSNAPGPQVDVAYKRQQRINDRLGGRVVAAYVAPGTDIQPALLAEIEATGFDVLVIAMKTIDQYETLVSEIDVHGLWDPVSNPDGVTVLMAMPPGFRWIATGADFRAWLPTVEELEIS